MRSASKSDNSAVDKERVDNRRLGTPNRPVAIARFVGNIFKESLFHPTATSYIDKRTGKLVGRDSKKGS